jgi:N-acetylmuramoyl-L-alanine amidase
MQTLIEVARTLIQNYGLRDVIGHDDIAPGRKFDPGPAFPMLSFRAFVMGRQDSDPPLYKVSVQLLNIRSGPGAQFDMVAPALKLGTPVRLIEMRDLWANVAVADGSGIQGWVRNAFISGGA